MKPIRSELADGIALTTMHTDRFKAALLTVRLLVPLRAETAAAYSLLTDVLTRGTEQYPTMQALSRRQDELYSANIGSFVQVRGETQILSFDLSVLEDRYAFDGTPVLREGMKLLRQIIFCPLTENGVFRADYVEQEKKNLIASIRSVINNKPGYALTRCRQTMCAGEPFAVDGNGTEADVEKITPESLTAFYHDVLQSAKVEIFYAGKKSHDELKSLVSELFPFTPRSASLLPAVLVPARAETQFITEQMDVAQCQMVLGFRMEQTEKETHPLAAVVFSMLFSDSPTSRLFMQVREKLHLCYFCSAVPNLYKKVMFVCCGLKKQNFEKAKSEVLAQLAELQSGKIGDEEFENAIRGCKSFFTSVQDDRYQIVYWALSRLLQNRSETPEESIEMLSGITKEDISEFASRIKLDTVYCLEGGAQ